MARLLLATILVAFSTKSVSSLTLENKVTERFGASANQNAANDYPPAAMAYATAELWNQVVQIGARVVQKELSTFTLSDFHDTVALVDLNVTEISCANLTVGSARGFVAEAGGFGAEVNEVKVGCEAKWRFKNTVFAFVHGSGTVTANANAGGTCTIAAAVEAASGKPYFKLVDCPLDLHMGLDFHQSKWTDILNAFKDPLSKVISGKIRDVLIAQITTVVNDQLNQLISSKFMTKQVLPVYGNSASMDFRFSDFIVTPPVGTLKNYFLVEDTVSGSVYAHNRQVEITPDTGRTATVSVDAPYVFGSLGSIYASKGYLTWTVNNTHVPTSLPLPLNTKSFKIFSPGLYEKYPDQEMEITATIKDGPVFAGTETGELSINAPTCTLNFKVLNGTTPIEVFVLGANLHTAITPCITPRTETIHDQIGITVKSLSVNLTEISSQVGTLYVYRLQTVLNGFGRKGIPVLINQKTEHIYTLPDFKGVTVSSLSATITPTGFLIAGLDAVYVPPP